jgi:hypothetical protein
MKERNEQFECSHCGQKFNFEKNAEEHEDTCSKRNRSSESPKIDQDGKQQNLVMAIWRVL